MQFQLPSYAIAVMEALERAGFRAYLVGGSLRDLLRGVTPHDYDMTTNATPEEMMEAFREFRVIPTGLQHGTLTVLSEGNPVEVTTHRVDGNYLDARRPDSVFFTRDLEEDLSRRDFTVNAMAWNPTVGLVDLFGGREDLEKGIIRTVGDATKRFSEDALRMMRAFRFCAQLQFKVEEKTALGAAACAPLLARISVERIFSELCRLLTSPNAGEGLSGLLLAGCAPYVFFDTVLDPSRFDAVGNLPAEAPLRLASIVKSLTPEGARALSRRWHAPNAFGDALAAYLAAEREALPTSPYTARRFLCAFWHHWEGALALRGAKGEDTEKAYALCRKSARDGTAVEIRRLALNGRELQERVGVKPEKTAKLLALLQDAVWQRPEINKKPLLLKEAVAICERESDFLA